MELLYAIKLVLELWPDGGLEMRCDRSSEVMEQMSLVILVTGDANVFGNISSFFSTRF